MAKKKKDVDESPGQATTIDREGHVSSVGSGRRDGVKRAAKEDPMLSTGKSASSTSRGCVGSDIPSGQMWKPPVDALISRNIQVPQIPFPSLNPR